MHSLQLAQLTMCRQGANMEPVVAYTFPLLGLADDLRLIVYKRVFAVSVMSALSLCATCRFLLAEMDYLRSRAAQQLQWHVCTHELDATVVLGHTNGLGANSPYLPDHGVCCGQYVSWSWAWTIHLGIPSLWDNIIIGICAKNTENFCYGELDDQQLGPDHEWAHGWGLSPKSGMLLRVPARLEMLPLSHLPTGNMLRLLPPSTESAPTAIDSITIVWDAEHGNLGFCVNGGSPFTATSYGHQAWRQSCHPMYPFILVPFAMGPLLIDNIYGGPAFEPVYIEPFTQHLPTGPYPNIDHRLSSRWSAFTTDFWNGDSKLMALAPMLLGLLEDLESVWRELVHTWPHTLGASKADILMAMNNCKVPYYTDHGAGQNQQNLIDHKTLELLLDLLVVDNYIYITNKRDRGVPWHYLACASAVSCAFLDSSPPRE